MGTNPKISVIVINWNQKKWLKNCFNSLDSQMFRDFEVILTDNASVDGSVEYVRENFPWVKIIANDRNLGFTGANNKAASFAKGRYLLFLNNDTRVHEDCLLELWKAVESDSRVGICSCRIFSYNGDEELSNGLGMDLFGYQVLSKKIFYAEGAALFINKELFIKLNGFDQKHIGFTEDVDLSWRAQLLGYKVKTVKDAIVYHECGGTITGSKKREKEHITSVWRRFLTERNIIRNQLKNYQLTTLVVVLPLHLFMLICEMFLFLTLGKAGLLKEIYLRALYENIKLFPDTIRERLKVQRSRVINDFTLLRNITFKISKIEVLKYIGIPKFDWHTAFSPSRLYED